VPGNVDARQGFKNALKIVSLAGRCDVPVAALMKCIRSANAFPLRSVPSCFSTGKIYSQCMKRFLDALTMFVTEDLQPSRTQRHPAAVARPSGVRSAE
jgi:hypothetical protein